MTFVSRPHQNPPAFNIPPIIIVFAVIIIAIHAVRSYLLSDELDFWVILTFAFVPARYGFEPGSLRLPPGFEFSGGLAADIWTYLTYGFLHGNWTHVMVNLLWMVAFGSALARRFGAIRFLFMSAAATIGGALLHQLFRYGDIAPMVGASAAVSGMMGAAIRFAFAGHGNLIVGAGRSDSRFHAPAVGLLEAFTDRRVIAFVAVWFGINFLFGSGMVVIPGAEGPIAWEAHVGGFLVGLLGFGLLDPPRLVRSTTMRGGPDSK